MTKTKRKQRTRVERLGLMNTSVPAATHDIMLKRVEPFKRLHLEGPNFSVHYLPTAIDRIAVDAYLQGLVDGAALGAKNPSIVTGEEHASSA